MRLTLLATLLACSTAGAQQWRTLDVARQARDSAPMSAKVQYGAGTFTLGAVSTPGDLYEMHLRYAAGNTSPLATYDPGTHAVKLGIESKNFTIPGGDVDQNEAHIALARGIPLDLTAEVGAADVKIDLGGLAVERLTLKTGATDASLHFSSPNAVKMRSMNITVGAAGFKATGLANARADRITLRAGIGDWDLYFDGTWTGDITLDAKVGLGSLTIHVPDNVRVDQNANAVLGAVSGDHNAPPAADSANNDDDDSDAADNDEGDSTSAVVAKTVVKETAKATAKAMAKVQVIKLHEVKSDQPRYTLHIYGGATLGEIQFDHKLAGAGGQ